MIAPVVFFRVHECIAQWALDIRTEAKTSAHFPDHGTLVGAGARNLLSTLIDRLLTTPYLSVYPHELDFTASGRWANMTPPLGVVRQSAARSSAPPVTPAAPARAPSSVCCGYHLAHLLEVPNFQGKRVACLRPTGCQLGPHVASLSFLTKPQALQALEESTLQGAMVTKTRDAIEACQSWGL
jgi:hypothetical protein